jgi:Domain of unknown function (DUF4136)
MKNIFFRTLIPFAAGVYILAAAVSTDYNHSADFAKYHTYSWLKVQATDSIWEDRIKHAVDSELSAKGWTLAPSGGDASVAAFGKTKNEQTMQTFYDGFGGGWGWRRFGGMGMGEATTTTENTPVGMLTVDVFDSQSKQLLWRGKSSETLSGKADKNEKKLEKDVVDMFKKFPPPAKG